MQYKSRRSITSAKNCDSSLLTIAEKERVGENSHLHPQSQSSQTLQKILQKEQKTFFLPKKKRTKMHLSCSSTKEGKKNSNYNLCGGQKSREQISALPIHYRRFSNY